MVMYCNKCSRTVRVFWTHNMQKDEKTNIKDEIAKYKEIPYPNPPPFDPFLCPSCNNVIILKIEYLMGIVPKDVFINIAKYLDRDFPIIILVCRKWKEAVTGSNILEQLKNSRAPIINIERPIIIEKEKPKEEEEVKRKRANKVNNFFGEQVDIHNPNLGTEKKGAKGPKKKKEKAKKHLSSNVTAKKTQSKVFQNQMEL